MSRPDDEDNNLRSSSSKATRPLLRHRQARQAVHDAGRVLARDPGTTGLVLFAYGEQFEDSFIRSDVSEDEFLRLAEAFRDQLWPDEATGPATTTARMQHARMALMNLKHTLTTPNSGEL